MIDTLRVLANLNVLRVERQSNPTAHANRSNAFQQTINRISDIHHKQPSITIEDLLCANVGGSRMMSYIFQIHLSKSDLPEVQQLLQQDDYRAAYEVYHSRHASELDVLRKEFFEYKRVTFQTLHNIVCICKRVVCASLTYFKNNLLLGKCLYCTALPGQKYHGERLFFGSCLYCGASPEQEHDVVLEKTD